MSASMIFKKTKSHKTRALFKATYTPRTKRNEKLKTYLNHQKIDKKKRIFTISSLKLNKYYFRNRTIEF
jgi:hypothetical protein